MGVCCVFEPPYLEDYIKEEDRVSDSFWSHVILPFAGISVISFVKCKDQYRNINYFALDSANYYTHFYSHVPVVFVEKEEILKRKFIIRALKDKWLNHTSMYSFFTSNISFTSCLKHGIYLPDPQPSAVKRPMKKVVGFSR